MAPGAPLHVREPIEHARGVAIIVALSAERATLNRAMSMHDSRETAVLQSGPGGARAGAAARAAIASGATALLSWGIAGGLEPQLQAGTVLVPKRVVVPGGERFVVDPLWRDALATALGAAFAVHDGDLLSVDDVLYSPSAKASAAERTGSVAVDMESAAIAQAAAAADVPFAAVRVVADSLRDPLPPNVDLWVDSAGRQRVAPVLGAALRPAHWPVLAALARRYRIARRTLAAVADSLVPADFFCPPQSRLT